VRRDQAEREQLAQEAEKKRIEDEKAAEAARLRAAGLISGRGAKSGRSRGGMMGRGRDTGLFGVTPQALRKFPLLKFGIYTDLHRAWTPCDGLGECCREDKLWIRQDWAW